MTRMNGPEKRRGGQHGTSSTAGHTHAQAHAHVVRTVATNPATSNASSSAPRNGPCIIPSAGPSSQAAATVISPPPKAVHALTGSTQTPANDGSGKPNSTTGIVSSNGGGGGGGGGNNGNGTRDFRDKDERIASLEMELHVMEAEFSRELERASVSESETASFWQSKHSAVHTAFLRADTELRLLRAEVDVREAERGELREGWEMMRREARERDELVRELRSQVRGLKEWVGKEARGDGGGGTVSDEVFAEGMGRLANGLQNWVIVHFRKSKIDLSKVDESILQEVSRRVPMYEEVVYTAKVHFLQSIVSSILVEEIFDNYFVGLNDVQAASFRQMEKLLAAFANSPEAISNWRSQMLSIMRRGAEASSSTSPTQTPQFPLAPLEAEAGGALITEPSQEQDPLIDFHTQSSKLVTKTINKICHVLDSLTGTKPPTSSSSLSSNPSMPPNSTISPPSHSARETALRVLLNNSIALSRLLSSQRAYFTISLPPVLAHQKTHFSAETMEDIGAFEDLDAGDAGDDSDGCNSTGRRRRRREVLVATFPMVVKMGDEYGGGTERFRNVIFRARVLCAE